MNESKGRSVRVEIFGSEYFVKADQDGDEAYIRDLAKYVDKKMREIAHASSVISTTKVAILASLNVADELHRLKKERQESEAKEAEAKVERLAARIEDALSGELAS